MMTPSATTSEQLDNIISRLNHQMTGNLARLEGLFRLYQQEGSFREELWECAFKDAKTQLSNTLKKGFTLCDQQHHLLPNTEECVMTVQAA